MKILTAKALARIEDLTSAYPLDIFPEPDLFKVREALEARGISIDSVSASNIRHALIYVRQIIEDCPDSAPIDEDAHSDIQLVIDTAVRTVRRYNWVREHPAFETEAFLAGLTPEDYDRHVDARMRADLEQAP